MWVEGRRKGKNKIKKGRGGGRNDSRSRKEVHRGRKYKQGH